VLQITTSGVYNEATNPDEVGVAQLTNGSAVAIENVPGPTTIVHVFSNLPSGWSTWNPSAGEHISTYSEAALDVEEVYNSVNGDASKVVLYGIGHLAPSGTPDEFEAPVDLFPVAGRLEIAKITASSEITSFDVTGVFVNNYYPTLATDGTKDNYSISRHGSAPTSYTSGGYYAAAFSGILFDEETYSSNGSLEAKSASSNLWAYNLLAPALLGTEDYFPHVVIKIDNIVVQDPSTNAAYEDGEWFLTIANVYLSTDISTKTPLDFEKSNIYHIPNVAFTLSDLGDVPELTTKAVTVEVDVKKWGKKEVLPILQ
jgi:hypothetical protein